ncbi:MULTISPECIES: type IV pilus modification protein PilV [unclassified Motilimonas]|uniref:type IV pilus modification protein PilV n=1 Tax=Motilimonas TaxID=1914248 RepID=UPI001E36917F|nr:MULTISPECIES: type IV pilus modification protein PilV [unclassified Motilimonas]MCE0558660.1 type IV pilus modification protein PilV [Motilimonas sp. E26]MDO6525690.1 type IV pilus modification protein PilV [Motilimonas sp. 1_MG-2023]
MSHMILCRHQTKSQKGFSLIETMITLFVLTTGLLGVAASQGIAKKSAYESNQRTLASFIAMDIAERLRLNRQELISSPEQYAVDSVVTSALSIVTPRCSACGQAQQREKDLLHWAALLQGQQVVQDTRAIGGLKQADACIDYDTNNGKVLIVISWTGRQSLIDGATDSNNFEKKCGTSSNERRQLILRTLVKDA